MDIKNYIKSVKSVPAARGTEHSYRTALKILMDSYKRPGLNVNIIEEASDNRVDGTPDYIIYQKNETLFETLVGFVECKKPDFDLEKLIDSEQIQKYSNSCENIILTNYKKFILLQSELKELEVDLLDDDFIEIQNVNKEQDLENLFLKFYGYEYQYIKTKADLIDILAKQSFYYSVVLRTYLENDANKHSSFSSKFRELFKNFTSFAQCAYNIADFCDVYSQSLIYGLLITRLDTAKNLNEKDLNYLQFIPDDYHLLYEFLAGAYDARAGFFPPEIKQALVSIGKQLNLIHIKSIQLEFARKGAEKDSIIVYLYEDFLKKYDELRGKEDRKENGVYYTPKEATDFITRGTHYLLQKKFDKHLGFLTDEVKVLDFSCGTGTFLSSVFDIISQDIKKDTLNKQKVKNKILKDIYGFELLFTPYIVSHTTLIKKMKDLGISIDSKQNERLGIYLTNTLDIAQHSISDSFPLLKQEHEKAYQIKSNEEILAIIGNPPYNINSKDKNQTIIEKVRNDYAPNDEPNLKPLYNDYIKFIRFAQHKIEKTNKGVVGIITDNGFLTNRTFYKFRKSLCDFFDEIYICNLHGQQEDGDKNIFDITVGVTISFFIKHPAIKKKAVFYYSSKDNGLLQRRDKLEFLKDNSIKSIDWKELNPSETKNYFFIPKDFNFKEEYKNFWSVKDIFNNPSLPIMSKKDYNNNKQRTKRIAYQYSEKALCDLKEFFINNPINKIKKQFDIEENGEWTIEEAQKDLKNHYNPKTINYRVFDSRLTSLSHKTGFLRRPSYKTIGYHFEYENLGIFFEPECKNEFNHVFITDKHADFHCIGSASNLIPLYLYHDNQTLKLDSDMARVPNFTDSFYKKYLNKLSFKCSPEEIMAYIYGVTHSPIYREKYLEFLKIDFPAVPMTTDKETFYQYAEIGQNLINLHLLKDEVLQDNDIKVNFKQGLESFIIQNITPPSATDERLKIQTQTNEVIIFEGVATTIYEFKIGTYKPIDKWLKYRKKDKVVLSFKDLEHIKKMIISIKNTIIYMDELKNLDEQYLK